MLKIAMVVGVALAATLIVPANGVAQSPDDAEISCRDHPCSGHTYVVLYRLSDGAIEGIVGYDTSSPRAVGPESIFKVGEGQAVIVVEDNPAVFSILNKGQNDRYYVDLETRTVTEGTPGEVPLPRPDGFAVTPTPYPWLATERASESGSDSLFGDTHILPAIAFLGGTTLAIAVAVVWVSSGRRSI